MDLTQSTISAFLDCPRKYEWVAVNKIFPTESKDALRFGSAFHLAVELWDLGVEWDKICDKILLDCIDEYEAVAVCSLVSRHHHFWENDGYEVIETEQTFKVEIEGFTCRGKIDRIIKLPDGRTAVQEYKTTSLDISPGAMYWKRLPMNLQVSLYQKAAGVDSVIYDVVKKPRIKPKQVAALDENGDKIVTCDSTGERVYKRDGSPRQSAAAGMTLQRRIETLDEYAKRIMDEIDEDPEMYFQRVECPRTDVAMQAGMDDLVAAGHLIHLGQYPRNPGSCLNYGKCDFFELCSANVRPDGKTVPAGFVQLNTAHPELDDAEPTSTT